MLNLGDLNADKQLMLFVSMLVMFFIVNLQLLAEEPILITKPKKIEINEGTLSKWMNDFYQNKEVWIIEDRDEFIKLLNDLKLEKELIDRLGNSIAKDPTRENVGLIASHFGVGDKEISGYINLNPEIKSKLPPLVKRAIYTRLMANETSYPRLTTNSIKEMNDNIFSKMALTKNQLKEYQSQVIQLGDKYHLPITPELWGDFSESTKSEKLRELTSSNRLSRRGLDVTLQISSDEDIEKVATKYAGERDPEPIKRYLRSLFKKNNQAPFILPLEKIMHSFMRKKVNTFDITGGPNCNNTGLCSNQFNSFQVEFSTAGELRSSLGRNYLRLADDAPLKAGDLILYVDESTDPYHVATYIDENLVFTKNGINKYNPYIFQYQTDVEAHYYPDGDAASKKIRYRPNPDKLNKANCYNYLLRNLINR